jgi:hypothetical protein
MRDLQVAQRQKLTEVSNRKSLVVAVSGKISGKTNALIMHMNAEARVNNHGTGMSMAILKYYCVVLIQ